MHGGAEPTGAGRGGAEADGEEKQAESEEAAEECSKRRTGEGVCVCVHLALGGRGR